MAVPVTMSSLQSLAFQFALFGMSRSSARELAEVVVSSVEGALVTARAFRSPAPFDSILAALVNHATQLGLAERGHGQMAVLDAGPGAGEGAGLEAGQA